MAGAAEIEPEILASPARMVEECYRLISFPPGPPRSGIASASYSRLKAVLALRVFPEDGAVTVMTLEEYMVHQMRAGMTEHGYTETIINHSTSVFGDIAEARVDFTMTFGGASPVPALDIFQLARREGRWWIVCIISDMKHPARASAGA